MPSTAKNKLFASDAKAHVRHPFGTAAPAARAIVRFGVAMDRFRAVLRKTADAADAVLACLPRRTDNAVARRRADAFAFKKPESVVANRTGVRRRAG